MPDMQGDDDNPYRSPASAVVEVQPAQAMLDAGKWRRFFNLLLDYVGMWACFFVVVVGVILVGGEASIAWVKRLGFWQEQLLGVAMMVIYYTSMEGLFGSTLGKWITGTRVVDEHGGPPTWRQALLRSLARLIPFEAFSVLLSEDGATRGWHDSLPRTRVVLRKSLQAPGTQVRVVV